MASQGFTVVSKVAQNYSDDVTVVHSTTQRDPSWHCHLYLSGGHLSSPPHIFVFFRLYRYWVPTPNMVQSDFRSDFLSCVQISPNSTVFTVLPFALR